MTKEILRIRNRTLAINSRNYRYLMIPDTAAQFLGYTKKVNMVLMETDEGKHIVVLEVA